MKFNIKLLSFGLLFMVLSFQTIAGGKKNTDSDKFRLEFKVEGIDDSMLIMANYFGLKQYYFDTAWVNSKGLYTYESDSIPGGIYMVVMPDKASYFEFLVDGKEKLIKLETKFGSLNEDMKVVASEENKKFYTFQTEMAKRGAEAAPYQEMMARFKADSTGSKVDSLKWVEEQLENINTQVMNYKSKFIADNEGSFVAKVFKTSQEPEVPENSELTGDDLQQWKYDYFKANYLKDVDFSDERLLRTPVLGKKIQYYIEKLTLQIPDSINEAADMMAERAKSNKEVFKYVVHWITNNYEKSKIMGMDGVFVHMANKYYCTEEGAWWIDSASTVKICERAEALEPLLIGEKAQNIVLVDSTEKTWHNLHEVESELTIVVFWSPTCGHCKKAVPQLEKEVHQVYKDSGIFVFGVCTELEMQPMRDFIKSKKLTFLNVSDTKEINKNAYDYLGKGLTTLNSLNFRSIWDVYSTPQVYVLDKNKEIIAKKLGIEQLPDFIKDWKRIEAEKAALKAD